MSNTKNKPGIHLFKDSDTLSKPYFYWHTIAKNGRLTANGETHSRKANALKSIRSTAITMGGNGKFDYYDHSKPNSPKVKYV